MRGDSDLTRQLVVCHDCELPQRRVALPPGGRARCVRCGALLYRSRPSGLQIQMALNLAAILVFLTANAFPIVTLKAQGAHSATTLAGTALALWRQGMEPVAALVALTAILVPALELFSLASLLWPLALDRVPAGFVRLLVLLHRIHPWSMAEVFLMGVLVALVKLAHLAEVTPGIGLWSFGALIVLLALNAGFFDSQSLWRAYRAVQQDREASCV
jgi:paraquat-inducible protein A